MATILLVDDEQDLRSIYRLALESRGHVVLDARNGSEALALLEKEAVSLVVTDVVMPKMGGRELAWRLASHSPRVPVILLSGILPPEHLADADEVAPVQYLLKPIEPHRLVEAVEAALAREGS